MYNLPKNGLDLLDSPVPMITGLSLDKQFIINKRLDTKYKNQLFVILDVNNFEIINSFIIKDISNKVFKQISQ